MIFTYLFVLGEGERKGGGITAERRGELAKNVSTQIT